MCLHATTNFLGKDPVKTIWLKEVKTKIGGALKICAMDAVSGSNLAVLVGLEVKDHKPRKSTMKRRHIIS